MSLCTKNQRIVIRIHTRMLEAKIFFTIMGSVVRVFRRSNAMQEAVMWWQQEIVVPCVIKWGTVVGARRFLE